MLARCARFFIGAGLLPAFLNIAPVSVATADEAGVSFWLPGQYGSFAAAPGKPGLSFEATYYHATASAGAGASFERGGSVEVGVKSPSDFVMLTPTYSFESFLLGGQPALGMTALVGRNVTSVSAALTGPPAAPCRDLDRTRSLASATFTQPLRSNGIAACTIS